MDTTSTAVQCNWEFRASTRLWQFLGFRDPSTTAPGGAIGESGPGDTENQMAADYPALRAMLGNQGPYGVGDPEIEIESSRGVFADNYGFMPAIASAGLDDGTKQWGIFQVDGQFYIRASYDDTTKILDDIVPLPQLGGPDVGTGLQYVGGYGRAYDGPPLEIRQIVIWEGTWGELVPALFASTGTAGYNHADHDRLPYGYGLAIPWGALGDAFLYTSQNAPGADKRLRIVIDKPRKFMDVINVDAVMRGVHLIWKAGALRWGAWVTPTIDEATHTIDESDKSEPVGNDVNHKVASVVSDKYQRPITTIEFNYSLRDKAFLDDVTFYDSNAIDDLNGAAEKVTLSASNTFDDTSSNSSSGIEELIPEIVSRLPYWSRPIRLLSRSVSPEFYFDLVAGDVINLSDPYARDPRTGERGFDNLPALCMRARWVSGGRRPGGQPVNSIGEFDAYLMPSDRVYSYAPCAQVDDTAANGGYDAGTAILTTYDNEHSEPGDPIDASHFENGDQILIVEIDPVDPANPTKWVREAKTITGNQIELLTALAAPAWDATKRYRIISQTYSAATADQHAHAYQADDADGKIEDVAYPYNYGDTQIDATPHTAADHTELPARHATVAYGDGKPRDTGYERDAVRMINNLWDHKTAHQTPVLWNTALVAVTAGASEFDLLAMCPVFCGPQVLTGGMERYLWVAPFFRSNSGGSVTCRITLCAYGVFDDSLTDVVIPGAVDQVTFTTSSTTWATPAEQKLDLRLLGALGYGFILIEGNDDLEIRGLAQAIERERV